MNAKHLIAAVLMSAAAGAVLAQSHEFVAADAGFKSTKSRAEVMAELKQAQSEGLLSYRDDTYPIIVNHAGMGTNAEVRSAKTPSVMNNDPSSIYFGA